MARPVALLVCLLLLLAFFASAFSPSDYDVVWDEPSDLETESMPLGNGDMTLQTWVERSTGDLLYYAQTASSFEENGQVLKLIRGRLHITPTQAAEETAADDNAPTSTSHLSSSSPAQSAARTVVQSFRHHLHVLNVSQTIAYTLPSSAVDVSITVWVDRFRPVTHFTVSASKPVNASLSIEMWRTSATPMDWWSWGYYCDTDDANVDPDTFLPSGFGISPNAAGELLWFHRNDHQSEDDRTYLHALKLQGLTGVGLEEKDVLRNRTFGGYVTTHDTTGKRWSAPVTQWLSDGSMSAAVSTVVPLRDLSFDLYSVTATTDSAEEFLAVFKREVQAMSAVDGSAAWMAHEAYWAEFHNRSYIEFEIHGVNSTASYNLTRDILLQRLLDGMDGISAYPIHFNGQGWNIGTYDGNTSNGPDYRQWGSAFWWQNVRQPYYPAVQAGDWDILRSMFAFYQSILDVQETRVRAYYNHSGAYFEETTALYGIMVDGVFGYGCQGTVPIHGNPTIRLHWDGSLELCLLMVAYYRHTGDTHFLNSTLLPVCSSIMTFFREHYPQRDSSGHTVFFPSQALETWQCNNPFNVSDCVTNSVVFVSGVSAVLRALLSLDSPLIPPVSRTVWSDQFSSLPPLPSGACMGDETRHCLRPGDIFVDQNGNGENVELYAVWPYHERGLGMEGYDTILNNYWTRLFPGNTGWTQDVVDAAFLGLREETAAQVVDRVVNSFNGNNPAKGWKFPVFAGPLQDSTPAADHFSNLRAAVTAMLVQEVDSGLFSLSALKQQVSGMHVLNATRIAQHDAVQPGSVSSLSVLLLFASVPATWDFAFKLHVSGPAVITARCVNDTLTQLDVTPASRKSDIVLLGCLTAAPPLKQMEAVASE